VLLNRFYLLWTGNVELTTENAYAAVSDCAGNGKAMGESLGKQYCAIGALASGPPQRGMTQQICNAVEQTVCESMCALPFILAHAARS
jgi:hypothetical protein